MDSRGTFQKHTTRFTCPNMLDRFGSLQCFVHERRYKEVKRYGDQLQTGTAGVEKSLLRDVVLSHFEDLKAYGEDKLVKWVKAPRHLCAAFAQYFRLPFLQHEIPYLDVALDTQATIGTEVSLVF